MAEEKRSAILQLDIDQKDGITELERLKNVIIGLKLEQAQLNKDFKAGTITQKEYASESVRVETQLKKNNSTYNEQQRQITGVKNVLTELTKSNKVLADEIKNRPSLGGFAQQAGNAAKEMNIAGVSLNSITDKMVGFLNPTTAAVGAIAGLTAAFLKNEQVQRIFRQASEESAAIIEQLTADVVNTGKAAGEASGDSTWGRFLKALTFSNPVIIATIANMKVLDAITGGYISRLQGRGKEVAASKEALRQLELSAKFSEQFAKDDERKAELQRRIRDDEQKSVSERIAASELITSVLERSRDRTITVIKAQIEAIKNSTIEYDNNRDAQLRVAQLEAQIADKKEEITGKLTENATAYKNLNKEIREQILLNRQLSNTESAGNISDATDLNALGDSVESISPQTDRNTQIQIDSAIYLNQVLAKLEKERIKEKKNNAKEELELRKLVTETEIALAGDVFAALSGLFDQQSAAYKVFASAETLIATYSSAQKSYDALAGIPIVGPALGGAAAAAAVVAGLARVAQINEVEFAEGGWTGPGKKHDVAGVVHADEYVTPKWLVHAPQAQQHLQALETMRLRGYSDGGLVTNSIVNQNGAVVSQLNQMMARIERLEISVSVKEINKVQKRVNVKEGAGIKKQM